MKLSVFLFLLFNLISLAEENLTIHDLQMKMELDKSKPNYLVVNIIPDDTEEKIVKILKTLKEEKKEEDKSVKYRKDIKDLKGGREKNE
ncbi:hypothetical protein [Fusobacterium sp. SYSU M8D902]|uniref:hypothetical protein n=1 Tax=Fusobacterium sp. SYSU M8D902 TaxID=3159562 RepID=UPI0032E4427D